jgi:DNA-binding SARP family transcriptional activator/tetratricopeptide (TPR) repeat protein
MHRLLVLGGLSLLGPEGPVTGRGAQRRRLALLALLAAEHPRSLSRDKLIAYLWPERDTDAGRHLLRQALYLLRRSLGEDAVLSRGEEVRLEPERLRCDLWEFREALERDAPEAAVAAYAAPFLDGVFLSRADEFERWVEAERAQLALRYGEALEALGEQCDTAGDPLAAAGWWRRLAEHDPCNSRVALRLMQALDAAGDRAGALRHAAAHAALLQAEFGAEPDAAIESLAARLREEPSLWGKEVEASEQILPAAASREVGKPETGWAHSVPDLVARDAGAGASSGAPDSPGPGFTERRIALPLRVRHLVLPSVLLLGLLGTMSAGDGGQYAMRVLGIGPGESLVSRGVLAERERILLADFASPTGDSVLARVATEAFRIDVAQSPILTLVEPQQVNAALGRMQRSDVRLLDLELAREVAVREGVKAVLAGEIARSGTGYLLSARLLAAESGEILAAHRETAADSTALLPALDRLSKQLRRRIGESLRTVRANAPLEQVTTSSLQALRKYSQAEEVFRREGDSPAVITLLEDAIALDTTFAMAYRALGMALARSGAQHGRQAKMFSRAYRHRDRLPDRERYQLLASYYAFHTWEPEKAIAALHTLLETYPHDLRALNNLGAAYTTHGDFARAEETYHRALAVDSSVANVVANLLNSQFGQGEIEAAETTLRRLAARFPGHPLVAHSALFLAAAHTDYAAAESVAHVERAAKREDLSIQAPMARRLSDLAIVRGRLSEAERYTSELSELNERTGLPGEHLVEALHLAHLDLTLGRSAARALARVELVLGRYPLAESPFAVGPYPDLAALYARAGQPERARAVLAAWEAAAPADLRRIQMQWRVRPQLGRALPWVLGEIALAEGRPLDAAQQFRLANAAGCSICTLPHLGRAYDAAAQPDSAIAVYERYLRTPTIGRLVYDVEWRAPVLERLGQIYEERGDHAKAAEHYRSFVALWQDADAELQPRVREARRRVAALAPQEEPVAELQPVR